MSRDRSTPRSRWSSRRRSAWSRARRWCATRPTTRHSTPGRWSASPASTWPRRREGLHGALAFAGVDDEDLIGAEIQELIRLGLLVELGQIGDGGLDLGLGDAAEVLAGGLAGALVVVVHVEQPEQRVGGAAGRDLDHLAAEHGALAVDAAAQVQGVLGDDPAADAAHAAVEADPRDVVLAARIRAAADLDVQIARRGHGGGG